MSLKRSAAGVACLLVGIGVGVWTGGGYLGYESPGMLLGVILVVGLTLLGLVACVLILSTGRESLRPTLREREEQLRQRAEPHVEVVIEKEPPPPITKPSTDHRS
jgi:hypothetical protein